MTGAAIPTSEAIRAGFMTAAPGQRTRQPREAGASGADSKPAPYRPPRRGGKPPRRLLTGQGGPIQDAWYASSHLQRFLSAQLGLPVVPAGNRGGYSYYVSAGDFLDLHRDIETCDVTLITVLHDNSAATDESGSLVLYPGRIGEPLSHIRARPEEGAWPIKVLAGQSIVIFGGVTPHRVRPTAEGQTRIISALCFRAVV